MSSIPRRVPKHLNLSTFVLSTALILSCRFEAGGAETDVAREFKQAQQDRDKQVAASLESINRKYLESLGQLQKKAMQSGDLDTAVKIKEAMAAIAPSADHTAKAPAAASVPGPSASPATVGNSALPTSALKYVGEWTLTWGNYHQKRVLNADGTLISEYGKGKWRVEGGKLKLGEGKYPDTFDLPGRGGVLHGFNNSGGAISLERNKPEDAK